MKGFPLWEQNYSLLAQVHSYIHTHTHPSDARKPAPGHPTLSNSEFVCLLEFFLGPAWKRQHELMGSFQFLASLVLSVPHRFTHLYSLSHSYKS